MADETAGETGAETTETSTSQEVDTASLMDTETTEEGKEQGTETEGKTEGEETETDTKEGAEKDGEQGKKEGEDEGAPEEYADFEVEEGIVLDEKLLDSFKAQFKEEGLTQAQAQKRIDQGVELSKTWTANAIQTHQTQVNEWRDATRNDPEIGGDKLQTTLAGAKQVRDQFGSEGLVEVLDTYGLGNHPEVIRFFSKVRAAISDDTFVKDGKPTGAPKSAGDVLFGNTNKKQG